MLCSNSFVVTFSEQDLVTSDIMKENKEKYLQLFNCLWLTRLRLKQCNVKLCSVCSESPIKQSMFCNEYQMKSKRLQDVIKLKKQQQQKRSLIRCSTTGNYSFIHVLMLMKALFYQSNRKRQIHLHQSPWVIFSGDGRAAPITAKSNSII